MEALKKNREFKCTQTTAHATKDACKDIKLLTAHLSTRWLQFHLNGQSQHLPEDPTETGMKICNTSWVKDTLSKLPAEEEEDYSLTRNILGDLDYELSDVAV